MGPKIGSGNVTVKVRWPSFPMEVTYVGVPPNTRLRAILPSRYPTILVYTILAFIKLFHGTWCFKIKALGKLKMT